MTSESSSSFKKLSAKRAQSVHRRDPSLQKVDPSRLLKDLIDKVKPWIDSLGLSSLLTPCTEYTRDPLRNGVLLCSIISLLDSPLTFCPKPASAEDVYRNIHIALSHISAKIPLKRMEDYFYTEPQEIWALLHTIMMFFPEPPVRTRTRQCVGPYSLQMAEELKESLKEWVSRIVVTNEEYETFEVLVQGMRTGELLAQIVKRLVGKEVIGVQRNPKTVKVCLANVEKSLRVLQADKRVSQQYLRDPLKVVQGNSEGIMLLLEDLHRMHAGLPARKRGRSYHAGGPYIVKFPPRDRTREKRSLTPQRSYSNISYISCEPKKNESKQIEVQNESFSRKLVTNSKSAMDFYKPVNNSVVLDKEKDKENYQGFEWIKKIEVKVPENLDLLAEYVPGLSNGEVLCKILSVLEMKDIEGVRKCNVGTPQAKRNVKLAFEILKKKPGLSSKALFMEEKVWLGEGNEIRFVLGEIYRLYKNTIYTLIRFNRKYRGNSWI